ncbi:tetratricopeptide repeat protein [Lentimicrobium sp. S6]|uniref:tetratricopeptide repeat protein n=1 Tax=Lentimicrobium sp. S6 TaxID=2735872 RepID=UPI001554A7D0|nr:tetratricopeptide repeat protein [Lentimicrobium sp. S6]NPD47944.1 tetratricopeptide repeat protein [Lentimicrobium sp. S6]
MLQNRDLWIYGLIILFGFTLYSNTINHGFVLDDPIITTENKFVNEGFSGLKDIFSHGYLYGFNRLEGLTYRPLVLASLAIETAIWGSNPSVHHFFNLFFFVLTGLLLFLFTSRLFPNESVWLPMGITLLFLAHPIHTEVVANIKSRDEILSFLFGITSLLFLFKYTDENKIKNLMLSLLFFFFSLISKETGLAFIGVIPLSLYFFRSISLKKIVKISSPFLGFIILYFLIRYLILDEYSSVEDMDKINNSLMALSGIELWATKIMILGKYLVLLLFPHPLSYDYSFNQIPAVGMGDWKFILALIAYISLFAYAIYGLIKKKPLAYGIIFFLSLLFLVSNLFVIIGATMAERFVYASSFGFTFALGYALYKYLDRKIFYYVLGTILLLYSFKTISRNSDWESPYTLYKSGLITAPNSARAANHFGTYHRQEAEKSTNTTSRSNNYQEAIKHYQKALVIYPQYREAEYNQGVCYNAIGKKELARACYERVLEYDPNDLNTLNNMGVYYFEKKNYEKGIEFWKRVIAINNQDILVLGNLAAAYFNLGEHEKSIEYQLRILQIEPYNKKALGLMIRSYKALGNHEKALEFQERLK